MQERRHVKTVPGEPHAAPEYAPHAVHKQEGENVQMDDINIPLVSVIVAFFAVLLAVTIVSLQAWFYNRQAEARAAQILPQEDRATWLGGILAQQRDRLNTAGLDAPATMPGAVAVAPATAGAAGATKPAPQPHIRIDDAMAAIVKDYSARGARTR